MELAQSFTVSEGNEIIFRLLEEVKGFSGTDLHLKAGEQLSDAELEKLNRFVMEIRSGRPLQYVLGYAWFCGMKFPVNENVLIPRPETEELCEWIIEVEKDKKELKILDIGTGSGCIAITLKKKFPRATVDAIDISGAALQVAIKNAELNQAEINFMRGDILSAKFTGTIKDKYDVIVSNPPYVRKSEMDSMADSVKLHEPHAALFVEDEDPLIFYRNIAAFAKTHLKQDGKLFFEINEVMGHQVANMLTIHGFKDVNVRKDISGKERMIMSSDFQQ